MLKVPAMKVSDLTCLLCGSRLDLKLHKAVIGENSGKCPMCGDFFLVKITAEEMEAFLSAEEEHPLKNRN